MQKTANQLEKHSPKIWWSIRILEIITCLHIIANAWHHW
jgi:hypothetical protein